MNIVITNDDGIESPGLIVLKETLEKEHDVWVIAPDGNRSGVSHSLTLRQPIKVVELTDRSYMCDGTPVDCIMIVHHQCIPVVPDIIISGINIGPNLGSDIIFSGTIAAARQASMFGYPSLAVSVNTFDEPYHLKKPSLFVRKNLEVFIEKWNSSHFLNINFPNVEQLGENIKLTYPVKLPYSTEITNFRAPDGAVYNFYNGSIKGRPGDDGSDWSAVTRGSISICPINTYQTRYSETELYSPEMFSADFTY